MAELAIITTIISAATAVAGGVQQYRSAHAQADQLKLQQQAERTQAAIESEEQQKRLRSVLASQNAIFGAGGIDISSGTPSTIAGDTFNEAQRQSSQAQLFSDTRQSVIGSQISDTLSTGTTGLIGGVLGAGTSLINYGIQRNQIGKVPGGTK